MRKLLSIFVLVMCVVVSVFPQKQSGKGKPTPRMKSSEKDVEEKLSASTDKPVEWERHSFPTDEFSALFPRKPVLSQETFSESAMGTQSLNAYTAVGDDAVYIVGRLSLPYTVTDPQVKKDFYKLVVEGASDAEEVDWAPQKELEINGRMTVEIRGVTRNSGGGAIFRAFFVGKGLYYQMSMAAILPGMEKEERDVINKGLEEDFARFFDSFEHISNAGSSPVLSNPILAGRLENGIYTSEYFGFSIKVPVGWRVADDRDMVDVREHGRNVLSTMSSPVVPKQTSERKTLFLFSSKPLGADENYMMNCTPIRMPPGTSIGQFAMFGEKLLTQPGTGYSIIKKSYPLKIGENMFQSFDMKRQLGEMEYFQSVYLIMKKGHVLMFTATYDGSGNSTALEALNSIKFNSAIKPKK